MTHGAERHRELDRQCARAMGEAPGHALLPSRLRLKDMKSMSDRKPRILLLEAEIRTSERTGRQWYSAWLGRCRLVGFETDEPNERGHRVIKFFAEEPEPRAGTPAPARDAQTGDRASTRTSEPASPAGRPGGAYKAPRRESEQARHDRVAGEVAERYGVRGDADLDDEIPF